LFPEASFALSNRSIPRTRNPPYRPGNTIGSGIMSKKPDFMNSGFFHSHCPDPRGEETHRHGATGGAMQNIPNGNPLFSFPYRLSTVFFAIYEEQIIRSFLRDTVQWSGTINITIELSPTAETDRNAFGKLINEIKVKINFYLFTKNNYTYNI
jgi:hypothetical protein